MHKISDFGIMNQEFVRLESLIRVICKSFDLNYLRSATTS